MNMWEIFQAARTFFGGSKMHFTVISCVPLSSIVHTQTSNKDRVNVFSKITYSSHVGLNIYIFHA